MIKTTAWWQINTLTHTHTTHQLTYIIWHNSDFTINPSPLNNTKWKEKVISHLHHLFSSNSISLTELRLNFKKFALKKEH